jgi:hemoglobin-like flavoprotein
MAKINLIQHSFELAAERCEDLTPLVYRRLFREHPDAEAMFRHEENDLVKGSMLALASMRYWILPAIAPAIFA